MARIRTIKPEFFRHEGLQDLAARHGAHVMLVFAGLWGHCDKAGRFEWKPRTLKLDILPFLEFDMSGCLALLEDAGQITRYEVGGKVYGLIPSFTEHQNINGKEREAPEKFPAPPETIPGSNREVPVQPVDRQEGKGREEEGKGRESARERAPHSDQNEEKPPKRDFWPPEKPVPEPWLRVAEAERVRLGLAAVDVATVAAKFQAHHGARQVNPRTRTEWQSEFLKFTLNEKAENRHGSRQHGQSEAAIRILTR